MGYDEATVNVMVKHVPPTTPSRQNRILVLPRIRKRERPSARMLLIPERQTPVNHPPTATDQSLTTTMNKAIDIALGGTDPDAYNNLTAAIVTPPTHALTGRINGTINITKKYTCSLRKWNSFCILILIKLQYQ